MVRELTCIGCPMGCNLTVTINEDNSIDVSGNTCIRGKEYGIKECTHPSRTVTSSVMVSHGSEAVVSVKTEKEIPKELIKDCIKALKGIEVKAPVRIGDIIISDFHNTGVNIIATKNVEKSC